MSIHRAASAILTSLALASLVGCTGQAICAKKKECNDKLEDDSVRVCEANYDASVNALRANKEEECQKLADTALALDSCRAALDCDDFEEADLGGHCDDELDDFQDALNDAELECTSFD